MADLYEPALGLPSRPAGGGGAIDAVTGAATGRSARVILDGIALDAVTEAEVVALVRGALVRGTGGRIVTPNVDILRQARTDPAVRALLAGADLVVADGRPLLWAARLAGRRLPERVTGASLVRTLSAGLARDGRSVYLLGGEPADPGWRDGAGRAAGELAAACPGLRIAGAHSPEYGFHASPRSLAAALAPVIEAKPDLVLVGLGFPRQEGIIDRLRGHLPAAWFLGCGAAIAFAAGDRRRAPGWMQRAGLEWTHRLAAEPRRLAARYLLHDVPYAARLLARSTLRR
ncbi:WecB/TagA/CpsF family glycosyltransferase [Rhizomonospora bruguierae]|uniref:WecB/TagA/CpsF family glycosyltransferase n=1 Tax=Rhizomonospora bruguierae TaxID=1581705 RepID=UPI001BCCC590|nr:WecB/TagA/CpsF family glycosyltransferase [Micromonospora sp. NBRC 107566]